MTASLNACTSNEDKPASTKEASHDVYASTLTATVTDTSPFPEIPSNARVST